MAAAALTNLRPVTKVVQGQKMREGAGVTICRTVGTSLLRDLDPYLMLDELKLPAKAAFAGFPDHPHRGFETCSIMLEGVMEHRDSQGNHGVIGPGGVQWMTAGRGIIHSEMPKGTDGMLWGFQLWINLPKKDKMCKPRYQDYQRGDIPVVESAPGVSVRVMAGSHGGVTGPIKMRNPGLLMDVRLGPGASVTQEVPEGWTGFAYVYDGEGKICGTRAQPEHAMVLGPGDHVAATAGSGASGLKFLLIAGRPIGEPIVQHGPFVMNTQEEIYQAPGVADVTALRDYQNGRLVPRSRARHTTTAASPTSASTEASVSAPAASRASASASASASAGLPGLSDGPAAEPRGQPLEGRRGAVSGGGPGGSSSSSRAQRLQQRRARKEAQRQQVLSQRKAPLRRQLEEDEAGGEEEEEREEAARTGVLKLQLGGVSSDDEDWGVARGTQRRSGRRRQPPPPQQRRTAAAAAAAAAVAPAGAQTLIDVD